ncbi:MAG: hypothetical protein VX153_00490 [Verrucomicrobiota bacterium]|nr:hypothetical protein [Verrucomicrobiota bacterium]
MRKKKALPKQCLLKIFDAKTASFPLRVVINYFDEGADHIRIIFISVP